LRARIHARTSKPRSTSAERDAAAAAVKRVIHPRVYREAAAGAASLPAARAASKASIAPDELCITERIGLEEPLTNSGSCTNLEAKINCG